MKIMVIGCGSIGERHAKNLEFLGHTVIRFDPILYPRTGYHNSIVESDAIVIAAPTSMHDDYMEDCIGHYGKPTFVEKPIASNLDGSVIQDASKALMCGYNLRHHSCVKKAKEWLDAGLIGKPIWANFCLAQFNDRPAYLRDGVILNWSHELDLALYLLGPAGVSASSTRILDGGDDISDILLTHESGCRSTVHLDYITRPEQRRFFIQGDKGTIDADIAHRQITIEAEPPTGYQKEQHYDTWNENYIEEMQKFLTLIDNPDTPRIGCTGKEGLEVLKICLEVRKQAGLT